VIGSGSVGPQGQASVQIVSHPFDTNDYEVTTAVGGASGGYNLGLELNEGPGGSLLPNSGFAVPVVGRGNYQVNHDHATWSFTCRSGISGNGSGITAGNPPAPEGNQVAFLPNLEQIEQIVDLPAGTYTLSFLAAQGGNNTDSQKVHVWVDNTDFGPI